MVAVGAEDDSPDVVCVAFKDENLYPGPGLPNAGGIITGCRDNALSVRAERRLPDIASVAEHRDAGRIRRPCLGEGSNGFGCDRPIGRAHISRQRGRRG